MFEILASVDFWKIAAPLFFATIMWFLNERSKLSWEQYKRKEESYKELLLAIKGFTKQEHSKELKEKYLDQLNICWLYAPDDVINKGYAFLDSVFIGAESNEKECQEKLGAFVLAIRTDILSRKCVKKTNLSKEKFRTLYAT